MVEFHLNIISLDVPYPPNYGGAIDIFYKIKALHRKGVKIILHTFEYGRGQSKELEKYCEKVHYYPRKTGLLSNLSLIPYITYSRRNKILTKNLKSNSYPVLFEGLHSIYLLIQKELKGRTILLRSHNIEHDYFHYLARREQNPIRKIFFYKEAYLLKRLLAKIPIDIQIGAITPADTKYLANNFKNTFWLPPFHSNDQIKSQVGLGTYALYHGNLSVSENTEVAENLANLFANKEIQLVIAGKDPTQKILNLSQNGNNIKVIASPDKEAMDSLVKNAQVILLPTNQPTGIKLKLIESLYQGRFCIANRAMVADTELESLVIVEEINFYERTLDIMHTPFTEDEVCKRENLLNTFYDNANNAGVLLEKLYKYNEGVKNK